MLFIQIWKSYATAARKNLEGTGPYPGTVASWVTSNLGAPGAAALERGFDKGDLQGDADGWLVGKAMRDMEASGTPSLGEAWRTVLVSYPTPQLRLKAFLQGRFGASPATKLRSALQDCWTTNFLSPIGLGRLMFTDPEASPTIAQRDELCDAATARLLALAGL
ncbi:hypothetical protein [Aeromicrobium wangtongii]|uniref:Uncharacterized protein n=1 Tax=Aeromicrobium wangtongii TaxID=2969247 RepID=A0ABY5M662_9ACTN|nr:hypothetical protein [Aeromicrobium wangtongii]MCD9198231.1 hypothetical protein [Aeromicrobium wangtongii]UUP12267.1 hypothetical protein NQV15_10385 [Aeromicrobium wangtongii]